jgi:hypothetical protein
MDPSGYIPTLGARVIPYDMPTWGNKSTVPPPTGDNVHDLASFYLPGPLSGMNEHLELDKKYQSTLYKGEKEVITCLPLGVTSNNG